MENQIQNNNIQNNSEKEQIIDTSATSPKGLSLSVNPDISSRVVDKIIRNPWKWLALVLLLGLALTQIFDIDIKLKSSSPSASLEENIIPESQSETGVFGENEKKNLEQEVLPPEGVVLPVRWEDIGKRLVEEGVIDKDKFEQIYSQRGGLDESQKNLLYGSDNGELKIDSQNSGFMLNLLWAFGLANKSKVLDEGPMVQDSGLEGAGRFASTGGWSLAKGKAMDHYSKYEFVKLTEGQEELVKRVSENIYRPCCGNPTYFPDCNHGMAMLGLLELMASQGISEEEMYKIALKVNSYWFPETYLTLAKYFEKRGVSWSEVSPKEVLGSLYSSSSGYRQILAEVEPVQSKRGGGCGV